MVNRFEKTQPSAALRSALSATVVTQPPSWPWLNLDDRAGVWLKLPNVPTVGVVVDGDRVIITDANGGTWPFSYPNLCWDLTNHSLLPNATLRANVEARTAGLAFLNRAVVDHQRLSVVVMWLAAVYVDVHGL